MIKLYKLSISFFIFYILNLCVTLNAYDVTIVGAIKFEDARGRLPIGFIDILKDDIKINFSPIKGYPLDVDNLDTRIKDVVLNADKIPGDIAILFSSVCLHCASFMPNSFIKFNYSTFESSAIPKYWISYANKNFDAILVPDKSLVKAYKKSGINIPVFLIPPGLYLDQFLDKPIKTTKNTPFIFGIVAGFWPHKNHELLIKSFLNKFDQNHQVILKIHGNSADAKTLSRIKELIKDKQNIELINKKLNQNELVDFMSSLDCYVLVSKGEGFSVTPREAAALGVPTIISNNTAHKYLCKTPYFIPVKSDIKELSSFNKDLGGADCGYSFNTDQKDLENILEDVYENYDYYITKNRLAREWVQQYNYKNLKFKYLNLIRPIKIILGPENLITDDYFMTDSKDLYEKYMILGNNN